MRGYWVPVAEHVPEAWVVKDEIKLTLPNLIIFNELETKLIKEDPVKYRAAYLLVNSPTERIVYDTFDAAWTAKAPNGFMDQIGCNDYKDEILIIDNVPKPTTYDDLSVR